MGRTSRVVVVGAKETGKTSILEKAIYANSTVGKVRQLRVAAKTISTTLTK